MTYSETRRMIENSSWFKEIIEGDLAHTVELIGLSRFRFEEELLHVIERHARQQHRIDDLKRICHLKP